MFYDQTAHKELNERLGIQLPKDYLDFLKAYSGDEFDKHFFWVVPDDWGSGVDEFHSLASLEEYQTLSAALDSYAESGKPSLLPIANDGCFGNILLSTDTKDFGSIYFSCTWSDDGKTENCNGYGYWKVADSFSSFIAGLEEGPDE